jgi:serine/threonine protein phosphatase PrpC
LFNTGPFSPVSFWNQYFFDRVGLEADDEFFILGCDGIWDCLSNENAVKYVRERIDSMPPTDIGTAMLDDIISEDPRVTQGIGGDNMTIMIIDLQPATRKWRTKPVVVTEEES